MADVFMVVPDAKKRELLRQAAARGLVHRPEHAANICELRAEQSRQKGNLLGVVRAIEGVVGDCARRSLH